MKSNKELKINEIKSQIEQLKLVLKFNGITLKVGAESYGFRKVYFYKNEVIKELKKYNSTKKSIRVTSYTYKIGKYIISDLRQLTNEFNAINEISKELI